MAFRQLDIDISGRNICDMSVKMEEGSVKDYHLQIEYFLI